MKYANKTMNRMKGTMNRSILELVKSEVTRTIMIVSWMRLRKTMMPNRVNRNTASSTMATNKKTHSILICVDVAPMIT